MSKETQNNYPNIQNNVRIELLKIVYRHDRNSEDAVARAKVLEQYVKNGAPDNGSDGKAKHTAP